MKQAYNYYEILEIKSSAPQNEVSLAYDRVRMTYSGENPAIYTIFSEDEAREYLRLVEEAYKVLSNKKLRAIYDQRLFSGASLDDLKIEALIKAESEELTKSPPKIIEEKKEEIDSELEEQIKTKADWDGLFIQKVREYRGLTVERVGQITKINPYYIRAIEKGEASQLPAPVFIRGYVLQIAKTLKLDEKKVADSYMKYFKSLNSAEKK